jgi:hypothetical protein
MNTKNWALAIAAMAVMSAGQLASAEETSTTSVQTAAPSLTEKLIVNYWGNWRGPSVGTPNSYTPLPTGEVPSQDANDGVLWAENVANLGYKFNATQNLTYAFAWQTALAQGEGSALLNHYVGLRDKKMFQTGPVNHDMQLRIYVPTSDAAQAQGMITAPAIVDNATMDIGNVTIGLWNRVRYQFSDTGREWMLEVAPNANWQFSKTVAATLWIDFIQYQKVRGKTPSNAFVDVQPGINWDITPAISVNPYLNFYPNSLTADTTSVNLIISARAF